MPTLSRDDAQRKAIKLIADATESGLRVLDLSGLPNLNRVPKEILNIDGLKEINLSISVNEHSEYIENIELFHDIDSLISLDLSGRAVSQPEVLAEIPNLGTLKLSDATLGGPLPGEGLSKIGILHINGMKCENIGNLGRLNTLFQLEMSDTNLDNFEFLQNLSDLRYLGVARTEIKDLKYVSYLNRLTSLKLSGTAVRDIDPLENCPLLRMLHLEGCRISNFRVLGDLKALFWIDLDGSNIKNFNALKGHQAIEAIYASKTPLESVAGLAECHSLKILKIRETQVTDISPLASLSNLTSLSLPGERIKDFSPLASLTSLSDGAVSDEVGAGLGLGPNLSDVELSRISNMDRPNSTVLAINEIRNRRSMPPHWPDDYVDGEERADSGDDVSIDWIARLESAKQSNLGANIVPSGNVLAISRVAEESDQSTVMDPIVQQLHAQVQRKAQALARAVARLDNQSGWQGFGDAVRLFQEACSGEPSALIEHLGGIYGSLLELGSFWEMHNGLSLHGDGFVLPLEPEVLRPLVDLIKTAAPWLRKFPSIRELDDETGAFLVSPVMFAPAEKTINIAKDFELLDKIDGRVLAALLEASNRGDVQGRKAGVRGLFSAQNLVLAASLVVTGVWGTYTQESPLFKKAAGMLLRAETSITEMFSGAPTDIQLAMKEMLRELGDGPPIILPKPPAVRRKRDDSFD